MPTPTPTDIDLTARTVWGEARGEPDIGRLAVAWVIRNRAWVTPGWYGRGVEGCVDDSPAAVCLKRRQFSCWNADDPNRALVEAVTADDPVFLGCLTIARGVLTDAAGFDVDPTGGATHYYAAWMDPPPAWARDRDYLTIGGHRFLHRVA